MKAWFSSTTLGIPHVVWILQLVYVCLALVVLYFMYPKFNQKADIVLFILVMVAVNVIWRLAIRKLF